MVDGIFNDTRRIRWRAANVFPRDQTAGKRGRDEGFQKLE